MFCFDDLSIDPVGMVANQGRAGAGGATAYSGVTGNEQPLRSPGYRERPYLFQMVRHWFHVLQVKRGNAERLQLTRPPFPRIGEASNGVHRVQVGEVVDFTYRDVHSLRLLCL